MEKIAKKFVSTSLEESFTLLGEKGMCGREFHDRVYDGIGKRTGFGRDFVRDVFHPIAWGLYTNPNTPYEVVFESGHDDAVIRRREKVSIPSVSELTEKIVEEYGPVIKGKFEKWGVDPNTSLSQA